MRTNDFKHILFTTCFATLAALCLNTSATGREPQEAVTAEQPAPQEIYFASPRNNAGAASGIYRSQLMADQNKLSPAELVHEVNGPGWLTFHPTLPDVLYCVGRVDGKNSVVAINTSGERIGSQPVGDRGTCFLSTDNTGRMLVSTQFSGGSLGVFPLNEDGSIGEQTQLIRHEGGSGVFRNRQDAPHPHYAGFSADNRFVFVPDLGLDQLVVYRVNMEEKTLEHHGNVETIPGAGPRHMKFHPGGKYAFVLNEFPVSVTVYQYDPENGDMTMLETVPAITEEEKAENSFNSAAEIRVSGDGSRIYTSNRGHDSISVFQFEEQTASLTRIQIEPVHGSWPRNFSLNRDGTHLIAAGKNTNSISLFAIQEDGTIRHCEQKNIFVPGPACVAFPPDVSR